MKYRPSITISLSRTLLDAGKGQRAEEDSVKPTDLPRYGLGTLTFGSQTGLADAHNIVSMALDNEVSLIDCAEIYPHYPSEERYGLSEEIMGDYIYKNSGVRKRITLCTKIATNNKYGIGASRLKWIRGGSAGLKLNHNNINAAIDSSLKRLKTEYIDIYQVHWPERNIDFGRAIPEYCQYDSEAIDDFYSLIEQMNNLIKRGKILSYGVCNETPWGLMKLITLSSKASLNKPLSIQTPVSLLNRRFESTLAEVTKNEKIKVISYGTLAGGLLSGKYQGGQSEKGSRYDVWPGPPGKYFNGRTQRSVSDYEALSRKLGISLSELAYHFIKNVSGLDCTLLGVKDVSQLEVALKVLSSSINLSFLPEVNRLYLEHQDASLQ